MSSVRTKVETKYNMTEHSKVEHFINDVKYATISLQAECHKLTSEYHNKILKVDTSPVKERFSNQYEGLLHMIDGTLHMNGMQMSKLELEAVLDSLSHSLDFFLESINLVIKLKEQYQKRVNVHPIHCISDIFLFREKFLTVPSIIMPATLWKELEEYDKIRSWIDLTQTRIEDLVRAKKRILKVWNPVILEQEYESLIEDYHKSKETNLKYLSTSFWKTRKSLRKLFIEDIDLLDEQEFEVLYMNRKVIRENLEWLNQKHATIQQIFGISYQKEETCFEDVRRKYESFHSFYEQYQQIHLEQMISVMYEIFPQANSMGLMEKEFYEVIGLCYYVQETIANLKQDYLLFYTLLKEPREEYSFNDIRKTLYQIERVQQKKEWMDTNEAKILEIFGSKKLSIHTNWKMYLTKSKVVEAHYEFPVYQVYHYENLWEQPISNLFYEIVKVEQPIHEKMLLKRAAKILNLARITPTLKKELQLFLSTLSTEYEVIDGFVESKDKSNIMLRRVPGEKREWDMIADSEFEAAILKIIEVEHEIPFDLITKSICESLGIPRRNQKNIQTLEQIVKRLKRNGQIIRHSSGWKLQ